MELTTLEFRELDGFQNGFLKCFRLNSFSSLLVNSCQFCRKREEVDDDKEAKARNQQQQQQNRSTGPVDGVHQRAQAGAVDRPVDRRRRTVDRPVDRLTLPNSRLGTVDWHGRPGLGSVARSTD